MQIPSGYYELKRDMITYVRHIHQYQHAWDQHSSLMAVPLHESEEGQCLNKGFSQAEKKKSSLSLSAEIYSC